MKTQGHLDAWMRDQCDMDNEGDRLAWEQYQTLTKAAYALVLSFDFNRSLLEKGSYGQTDQMDALKLTEAALAAAEGEERCGGSQGPDGKEV